jgi:choice-of-anchor B domain-containing protein
MWRLIFLIFPTVVFGQGSFNVELLDHWHEDTLATNSKNVRYSDCWGYFSNGDEYALAGSTEGVHAFSISDEGKFKHLDFVPGKFNSPNVIHRDIKTYSHYAYAVCDEGNSSLQIIDLNFLPDSLHVVYENDTTFTRVHNLSIDEKNALMFVCSVQPSSGGMLLPLKSMQVYSLSNPELPTLVYDGPNDIPEVHDCYVRDNIAYLNCGFDGLRVYDFSNSNAPVFLQNLNVYNNQGYNHQGWMSPDGSRYVFGDESVGVELKNCSVNSNHEVTVKNQFGTNSENGSVPHNIVITNDLAFVAYYNEGFRVFDLNSPIPIEIAHYDTYPYEEDIFKMRGAWGMYAELPSKRLLVSDTHTGLFLFDFDQDIFTTSNDEDLSIYPNPISADQSITVKLNIDDFEDLSLKVIDGLGRIIRTEHILNKSYAKLNLDLSAGIYNIQVEYLDYLGRQVRVTKKVLVL